MGWVKNGLLLTAGGVIGGLIGLIVGGNIVSENYEDLLDDEPEEVDGIAVLVRKLRKEAETAMAACETEEAREAVYARIQASVNQMRDELQQRGEGLIAEIREAAQRKAQAAGGETEDSVDEQVQNIQDAMERAEQSLGDALEALRPKSFNPAGAEA